MIWLNEVKTLFAKDLALELRQRYALGGILLYAVSITFVVYMMLGEGVKGVVWAALFWIMMLFSSVNAVSKSFMQEGEGRQLYYYTLASPTAVVVAKMLYNIVLLVVVGSLLYGVMTLVLGNPIGMKGLFFGLVLLGAISFSIAFTFISAIASKAQQSGTLMAVLSFPVVVPILLLLMRLTKIALELMVDSSYWKDIVMLLSVDVLLVGLIFLLFPYLWRD